MVCNVSYGKGRIAYSTYDGQAPSEDVLRLAFSPTAVSADGKPLPRLQELSQNGFTVKPLGNGDCIVSLRHDGCRDVVIEGNDPQEILPPARSRYDGGWSTYPCPLASSGEIRLTSRAGARAVFNFEGNQVRLIGRADSGGGKADVYLDGAKQLCGIDCWCPQGRNQQVLYYKNGLAQGKHTLELVVLGTKNPVSDGSRVYLDAVQFSAAQGETGFGEGAGPTEPQRVIFGYVGRKDYVDRAGCAWRPATEFVLRLGTSADLVPLSFWTEPRLKDVAGTPDPELYRYGVHGRDFTAYFTVSPTQSYHVRLKFCQADAPPQPGAYVTNIDLCGKPVVSRLDIAATAGGLGRAVDLVFQDVRPEHGVISVRLWHPSAGSAMIQAIEVGPGPSPPGAKPIQSKAIEAKPTRVQPPPGRSQ